MKRVEVQFGGSLTAHNSADEFFVVDVALRVFVAAEQLTNFFISQLFSCKDSKMFCLSKQKVFRVLKFFTQCGEQMPELS